MVKMEKFFKDKIRLEYIFLFIIFITLLVFGIYYSRNTALKEIKFDDKTQFIDNEHSKNISKIIDSFIDNNIYNIKVSIKDSEIEDKESYNYIIGKEMGKKINLSIVLKKDNKYYMVKTVYNGNINNYIELTGYMNMKNFENPNEYDWYIYNNENNKMYILQHETKEDNNG